MNHAAMELHFASCMLKGTVRYTLDSETTPYFLLDDRFQITKLTDGTGKTLPYRKEPVTRYAYRQSAYTVQSAGGGQIEIDFESVGPFRRHLSQRKRRDRYNYFSKDRIFLYDNYLHFYPCLDHPDIAVRKNGCPVPCVHEPLTVYGLEDYVVYFSKRRADGACTIEMPKADRYLIYAFRKGCFYEARCGRFHALTQNKREQKSAMAIAQANNDVLNWYNQNLYKEKPVERDFELISLGFFHRRNAYVRDHLTVYENFRIPSGVCESYIPHELGHLWCISGTFSAAGFLDEGGAEWSAEIYRYHHDRQSFEKHRRQQEKWSEHYWKQLCRAGKNGKDAGVPNRHMMGFRFFNRIYKKFGLDTVRRCILCYALPDEQSPQTFLKRVRETESDAVYDFVLQETQDILSRFPQH